MCWKHLFDKSCPPSSAYSGDIDPVYRLIDGQTPVLKDFEPHIIKFPNKHFKNICTAKGTSVFSQYSSVLALQQAVPAFKNKKIAKGKIENNDGKILQKNDHITWWIEKVDPHLNFKVCP